MIRALHMAKRTANGMPFTLIASVFVGALLVPVGASIVEAAHDAYDKAWPVVEMSGQLLSFGSDEAVIALVGRKNRECSYVRIQAYSVGIDGNMSDTFIVRTDIPENRETKPTGTFAIGTWRVWPLPNSRGIVVYLNHLCGSRVVLTKVADIPLKQRASEGER